LQKKISIFVSLPTKWKPQGELILIEVLATRKLRVRGKAIPNRIFVKRQQAGRFFWSTLPKNKQHFPGFFLLHLD
jgi:hypothetical protein